MKAARAGFRYGREQLMPTRSADSYKPNQKFSGSTCCPQCGAIFHKGRWIWSSAEPAMKRALCPACRRINDQFPAGYVTLRGEYLQKQREQILAIARRCEQNEKSEHPLQRIMSIEDTADGVLITTTDAHLARNIAEQIHDACKGSLSLRYADDNNLLRATWTR
jgi:NMD protein affecting ribosome stability and mRNA decay